MLKRLLMMVLTVVASPLMALDIQQGFVRGLPPTQTTTAAFFRLVNSGTEPWTLTAVYSEAAVSVEIHEHVHDGGMMRMQRRDSLTIPADSAVEFKPGGLHLMLIGLKRALQEGEEVTLCFENDRGEVISAALPVVSVVNEHRHH